MELDGVAPTSGEEKKRGARKKREGGSGSKGGREGPLESSQKSSLEGSPEAGKRPSPRAKEKLQEVQGLPPLLEGPF